MLELSVRKDGAGSYRTLTEAVQSVPYGTPATIRIGEGLFEEKLFSEKKHLRLIGSGRDATVLRWADGAFRTHADGTPNGTFRSYTAFFGGECVNVSHLTIENTSGIGDGQAVAVYADAAYVYMEDVALRSRQDTLFCAPLPQRERQPRGFYGPRVFAPRVLTRQYYRDCHIAGDVDFIFGGADAVFEGCTLESLERGEPINGYVVAPSGEADGLGFVLMDCRLTGACGAGTVYLGRPWREHGKAVLLGCELGGHIHAEGWARWPGEVQAPVAFFAEGGCYGAGAGTGQRANWACALDCAEERDWRERAQAHAQAVTRRAATTPRRSGKGSRGNAPCQVSKG